MCNVVYQPVVDLGVTDKQKDGQTDRRKDKTDLEVCNVVYQPVVDLGVTDRQKDEQTVRRKDKTDLEVRNVVYQPVVDLGVTDRQKDGQTVRRKDKTDLEVRNVVYQPVVDLGECESLLAGTLDRLKREIILSYSVSFIKPAWYTYVHIHIHMYVYSTKLVYICTFIWQAVCAIYNVYVGILSHPPPHLCPRKGQNKVFFKKKYFIQICTQT